jgi:hypothetical protein
MKQRRVTASVVILLIISVIFLAGCTANAEPTTTNINYLKATATKLGIIFTFEYPASYVKSTPDAFEDVGSDPALSLLYYDPETPNSKADIMIYIRPCEPLPNRTNASAWTEEHIKIMEKGDSEFEIIQQEAVQIAGIDGEMLAYYSSALGDLSDEDTVCWDAYIDYQGYIWKILVMAVEEGGYQIEPVFEHLIQSFEFTD